ncbi:efflux transporter outer membrane subunit [Caballeronia mineralivorans]|jgi:multidrug efflux system outer membrane protein|uniref:efflux transporter outer membrane subunit n=1 Tax=Caballeronia mineralivorans TaxID=2010198 RepID=UPI002AFF0DC9|nr:efflux transporter outer membrane subunit [Caballeronia mineralivorans]MEA3096442.1 outer membrane protein multidrug efflux system [Caballeronia mineralivorans]
MKHSAILLVAAWVSGGCSITAQPTATLVLSNASFRHVDETQRSPVQPAALDETWPALFADPTLTRLIDTALTGNFDIASASARVLQARALLQSSEANLAPTVGVDPAFSRNRVSGTVDDALPKRMLRTWSVPVEARYEVDLWGRLRGESDVARQRTLTAQADAAVVRLNVATDVANDYLTLRYLDLDSAELRRSIALRQTALDLIERRVKAGASSDLDKLRASTELSTAVAELAESERKRENLVDALAVLTGQSVADLHIEAQSSALILPLVPVGMPATIIDQRPDLYAAKRRLDAASLQIGIAETAFLPSLTLTASGGFASRDLSSFLDRNSSVWGLAISAAETLFDGGKRQAIVQSAQAERMIADANYKAVTLEALRQVQDALNDLASQRRQILSYEEAAFTSAQASRLSRSRYEHGYVSYFEVVDADRDALNIERQLIRSRQAQAAATIALVRALGGGWNGADLTPAASQLAQSR